MENNENLFEMTKDVIDKLVEQITEKSIEIYKLENVESKEEGNYLKRKQLFQSIVKDKYLIHEAIDSLNFAWLMEVNKRK